ncbi:hypothetical protein [Staphylococcus sp. HMSC062A05]|uniref:hypothetical protein n=1 Tax=Staphylococcus sp. HMSC062A05 TaxID=1715061 RepID=UPI00210CEDBD|nr:hypothetical protein [Staphylococcus sp. HMSC062A05]
MFFYILFGGFSWMTFYGLVIENLYNIFIFIAWIGIISGFFFSICLRLWIKKYISF